MAKEDIAEKIEIRRGVEDGDKEAGALPQGREGHGEIHKGVVGLFELGGVLG